MIVINTSFGDCCNWAEITAGYKVVIYIEYIDYLKTTETIGVEARLACSEIECFILENCKKNWTWCHTQTTMVPGKWEYTFKFESKADAAIFKMRFG